MRKYSSEVILNLENEDKGLLLAANALQSRLSKSYKTTVPLIQFSSNNSNELKNSLEMLGDQSRLYIVAHGSYGDSDRIYGDKQNPQGVRETWGYEYTKLANILGRNLSHLKQESVKNGIFSDRLKISLIVCHAGDPHDTFALNSFAAKLQKELAKQSIYVDVNAYVTEVGFNKFTGRRMPSPFEHSEHNTKKQLGPKLAFRWGTDEDGNPVQVAYDAYQLKEHENYYRELQGLVQELRDYAESRKNEAGYRNAVATATQLATDIEREANSYFNGTDKDEAATKKFHDSSSGYIANAKKILGEKGTTQKLLLHIFEKIEKIIISILPIPSFMRQHLVKKRFLSHSLFFYKTPEQRIADRASSVVDRVRSISPVR